MRPTFLVMRPNELEELGANYPDVAKLYELVDEVKTPSEHLSSDWEYCLGSETDLIILKRTH